MRVLLDECVTRRLRRDFVDHTVSTVKEARLKGLQNSPLSRSAAGQYEVLVTVDQNLTYQQNLRGFPPRFSFLRPEGTRTPCSIPSCLKCSRYLSGSDQGKWCVLNRIRERVFLGATAPNPAAPMVAALMASAGLASGMRRERTDVDDTT
jgi:predicted nuclease of predicted toxin-antitoxin system